MSKFKNLSERLKQYRKEGLNKEQYMERTKKEDSFTIISKEFHSQIVITDLRSKTNLYLIIVDKRAENNKPVLLPCQHGVPINGYVYDAKNDAISVSCVSYHEIGPVNGSIQISMPNCCGWKKQVPLPFDAIIRLLNSSQLKLYKDIQEKYKANNFELHFIQMTGCN